MRKALLVTVVLLAFPATAVGRPFNQDEMRAVELAHDYWGKGPACQQIRYIGGVDQEQLGAPARGGSCTIWLSDYAEFSFVGMCALVAHEWGHLLGYAHDPIPGRTMSSAGPEPTPQCLRVGDRRTFRHLKARCKFAKKATRPRCVRRARRVAFG